MSCQRPARPSRCDPKLQDPANTPTTVACKGCHSTTSCSAAGRRWYQADESHSDDGGVLLRCHTDPNNMATTTMNHTGIASGCATCHGTGKNLARHAEAGAVQPHPVRSGGVRGVPPGYEVQQLLGNRHQARRGHRQAVHELPRARDELVWHHQALGSRRRQSPQGSGLRRLGMSQAEGCRRTQGHRRREGCHHEGDEPDRNGHDGRGIEPDGTERGAC